MKDSSVSAKERLEHIQQAITDIEVYTKNASKETYLNDPVLIHATLFQFAIIGEAIIHVDDGVLANYDYPWYKVRGFRNFIVHFQHRRIHNSHIHSRFYGVIQKNGMHRFPNIIISAERKRNI